MNSSKSRSSRNILFILILLAIIAVVLVYSKTETYDDLGTQSTKLKKVVVNQAFEHLLYIGLYVAKDKGFFEENGLDVRIDTGGGDAQAFSALTSGSAQFAQGDPSFVAIAAENGWQGKVIAMAVDRVAIWGVTYDPDIEPFSDPANFRDRKVATYPEPNTSYVVQKELSLRAGLKIGSDTEIVQVPFGSEIAALTSGKADIAQTIEPNVSTIELDGGRVVFSYPEAWGELAFTGVMVSQALIDSDPEMIRSFVKAYEKALSYISTDFEGALAVAMNRLPDLSEDVLRLALQRLLDSGSIPASPRVSSESWKKLLKVRVDVGDLSQLPEENFIDNSFYQ